MIKYKKIMNIASIDVGSNTVLLLISKVNEKKNLIPLLNLYRSPRLGKNITSDGYISESTLEIFYKVLEEYKAAIDEYNCKIVIAKATAAMRIAKNSRLIKQEVTRRFGFDIEVISGDEEARLSYLGAASTLPFQNEKIVIDIGGASSEVIYGFGTEIIFKKSFNLGAVSLAEKYDFEKIGLIPIYNYCMEVFQELIQKIPIAIPTIAVAGTPTTLSCMNQGLKQYIETKVEGSLLTMNELQNLIDDLKKLAPDMVLEKYGEVVVGREDVILYGAIILNSLVKLLQVNEVSVSGKGIRYGIALDFISTML